MHKQFDQCQQHQQYQQQTQPMINLQLLRKNLTNTLQRNIHLALDPTNNHKVN